MLYTESAATTVDNRAGREPVVVVLFDFNGRVVGHPHKRPTSLIVTRGRSRHVAPELPIDSGIVGVLHTARYESQHLDHKVMS